MTPGATLYVFVPILFFFRVSRVSSPCGLATKSCDLVVISLLNPQSNTTNHDKCTPFWLLLSLNSQTQSLEAERIEAQRLRNMQRAAERRAVRFSLVVYVLISQQIQQEQDETAKRIAEMQKQLQYSFRHRRFPHVLVLKKRRSWRRWNLWGPKEKESLGLKVKLRAEWLRALLRGLNTALYLDQLLKNSLALFEHQIRISK